LDHSERIAQVAESTNKLIRHAAIDRVRTHTRENQFMLQEVEDKFKAGQVLANWMSLILISGEAIRITLKLQFSHKKIKNIIYPIYSKASPSEITDAQSMDYMKELGNLIAGYSVQMLEKMGIPLGISLPLGTRGFYEIFADYTDAEYPVIKYSDLWCIEYGETTIYGTVLTEVLDINTLEKVAFDETSNDDDDEGEFDFL
jgi:CheY-specific phosphatase CheX